MRWQLAIAGAFVAAQIAAAILMVEDYIFSVGALVALALVIAFPLRRRLSRRKVQAVFILAALPFLAEWYGTPGQQRFYPIFLDFAVVQAGLHYCIAAQILLIFLRNSRPASSAQAGADAARLSPLIAVPGLVVMVLLGNVPAQAEPGQSYHWAALGVVGLAIVLLQACQTNGPVSRRGGAPRQVALAFLLAGILGVGAVVSHQVYAHRQDIDEFFQRAYRPSESGVTVGFSESAQLGYVSRFQLFQEKRTVLRVYADEPPTYLRGKAFDQFVLVHWTTRAEITLQEPAPFPMLPLPGGQAPSRMFLLREDEARDWRHMEFWPVVHFRESVFLPMAAAAVELPGEQLQVDTNGVIYAAEDQTGVRYTAFLQQGAPLDRLEGAPSERALRLPVIWDEKYRGLARNLFDGCETFDEKVHAVLRFLHGNFNYSKYTQRTIEESPLEEFLFLSRTGNCEFFATAAALLLRDAGVPTRYVTGFLVNEYNPVGEYWLARNRDAHAWVEAWDPEQEAWVVVEATPPEGVPSSEEASALLYGWDYFRQTLQYLQEWLRAGNLKAFLLERVVLTTGGISMVHAALLQGALLLLLLVFILRRPWFRRRSVVNERTSLLNGLLGEMDRRVRRCGIEREPHETLHAFTRRLDNGAGDPWLRMAARWYLRYALVRYDPRVPEPDEAELRAAMPVDQRAEQ